MQNLISLPQIINLAIPAIKASPLIHAMWLEGSYATGKYNEQSDIDVWLDVDDGTFDECIAVFRQAISQIVEINHESTKGLYSTDPKLMKQTFYLKHYKADNCIELDLQEHSRSFNFAQTEHAIKILFDKDNVINLQD